MGNQKPSSRNKWQPVWFIEPLDDNTKKFLQKNFPQNDFYDGIICADGIGRSLWQCDHNKLLFLFSIEFSDDLHYRVFMQRSDGLVYYQASAGRNGN